MKFWILLLTAGFLVAQPSARPAPARPAPARPAPARPAPARPPLIRTTPMPSKAKAPTITSQDPGITRFCQEDEEKDSLFWGQGGIIPCDPRRPGETFREAYHRIFFQSENSYLLALDRTYPAPRGLWFVRAWRYWLPSPDSKDSAAPHLRRKDVTWAGVATLVEAERAIVREAVSSNRTPKRVCAWLRAQPQDSHSGFRKDILYLIGDCPEEGVARLKAQVKEIAVVRMDAK